jgi:hypothetical protein
MDDGMTVNLYTIKVLPNTASQLVEAIFKQKDLSRAEIREMAAYLDERYSMSDYATDFSLFPAPKKDKV